MKELEDRLPPVSPPANQEPLSLNSGHTSIAIDTVTVGPVRPFLQ